MGKKLALTKGDMLIIGLVLLGALLGLVLLYGRAAASDAGLKAEIYMDGQLWETVYLAAGERQILLESSGGYNLLEIGPQGICMLESDCRNQDCVAMGRQDRSGAMIACLPHRLVVCLRGAAAGEVDAIAY